MPQEIITNRIQTFTLEYRDFVMSDFAEVVTAEITSRYRLNADQQAVFENGIFLYITLFLNQFQLTEFLVSECQMLIKTALTITKEVLAKLPNDMVSQQTTVLMEITQDTDSLVREKNRLQLLQTATHLVQPFIYVKTTKNIRNLISKYLNSEESTLDKLHELLGDIILGFYKIEDTVPLLQQELGLDARTAALLGADVLEFLAPLSDPNWQPPVEAGEQDTGISAVINQGIPVPTGATPAIDMQPAAPNLEQERSQSRAAFSPLADTTAPTYTSSQEALRTPLSDLPSYNAPLYQNPKPAPEAPLERPRWGS